MIFHGEPGLNSLLVVPDIIEIDRSPQVCPILAGKTLKLFGSQSGLFEMFLTPFQIADRLIRGGSDQSGLHHATE